MSPLNDQKVTLSLCIATIAKFQRNVLFEVIFLKHFNENPVSVLRYPGEKAQIPFAYIDRNS